MGSAQSGDPGQLEANGKKDSDFLTDSWSRNLILNPAMDFQLSRKKTSKKSNLQSQSGKLSKGRQTLHRDHKVFQLIDLYN
jgi:hypothetical protein